MTALHASAAVLLVVAGVAKLVRPAPTADLLAALGLPAKPAVAAAIGLGEVVLGTAALAVGGPVTAGATGVVYLGFTVAVVRALVVGAPSCGCFGRADAPPSPVHVVGDLVFAIVSFVAVAASTPVEVMDGQPAAGVPFVVLVGVIAGLSLVAFTALPEALGARRPAAHHPFRIDRREGAS